MLQNFINARMSGHGLKSFSDPGAISRTLAQLSQQRHDAAQAARNSGVLSYGGGRCDAAAFGTDPDKADRAMRFRMLAHEHAAACSRRTGERLDATIPMASQGLTEIYNQVYKYEHSDLAAWEGQIFDRKTDIDPAAEQYVTYERDLVAVPRVGSTYDVTGIPMANGPAADVGLIGNIVPMLVGYEGNFMEPRRTALGVRNGKPDFMIEQGKIEACQRTIAEACNSLWLYGDTGLGIDGLHSNPFIGNVPSSPGVWSGLTAQQLADELVKLFNFIPDTAQGSGLRDMKNVTLYLPPEQYNRIMTPTFANTTGVTPWQVFRDANGLRDDQVRKVHSFAAANSQVFTGGPLGLVRDRAYVVYKQRDLWDPQFVMSQPIEIPVPPRETGVGNVTIFHARAGGLWLPDARRVAYYEGL